LLTIANMCAAQTQVLLWPDGAPGAVGTTDNDKPALFVYSPHAESANGSAFIICPGGGYGSLVIQQEGFDIATWLDTIGVTGFVLRYRCGGGAYMAPIPMLDIQRAIRLVRAQSAKWKIDPNRIGVMGFSAGGHLASTAATHFDSGNPAAPDSIDRFSCRPDLAVMLYPVITMTYPNTHQGTRQNLIGSNPSDSMVNFYSSEKQVTNSTPPSFLAHALDDNMVPYANSQMFYAACKSKGVPVELHLYPHGGHGFFPYTQTISMWAADGIKWMTGQGFFSKSSGARAVATQKSSSLNTTGAHLEVLNRAGVKNASVNKDASNYNLTGKLLKKPEKTSQKD
jgi:acetyl esterase/lipase